jgi:hypothetical protein
MDAVLDYFGSLLATFTAIAGPNPIANPNPNDIEGFQNGLGYLLLGVIGLLVFIFTANIFDGMTKRPMNFIIAGMFTIMVYVFERQYLAIFIGVAAILHFLMDVYSGIQIGKAVSTNKWYLTAVAAGIFVLSIIHFNLEAESRSGFLIFLQVLALIPVAIVFSRPKFEPTGELGRSKYFQFSLTALCVLTVAIDFTFIVEMGLKNSFLTAITKNLYMISFIGSCLTYSFIFNLQRRSAISNFISRNFTKRSKIGSIADHQRNLPFRQ